MIHNAVFHADVDGIFCAALDLLMLNKSIKYRLHPVYSYHRGGKFNGFIKNLNIKEDDELSIFDFEDARGSTLWVDHHYNSALGNKPVSEENVVYNPLAYSAFKLLLSHFKDEIIKQKGFDVFSDIEKASKSVDTIDSALYKNVDAIFNDNSPIMIIRAYLESMPDNVAIGRIVEVIANCNFNLQEAIEVMGLTKYCVDRLKIEVMKTKKYMEVYNKISVVRQRKVGEYPRYSENFIRPDVKYNIRVSAIGYKKWHIQVSFNNWHKEKNEVHIGKFLANLTYMGGGGHYNVGGGVIEETMLDQFLDDFDSATNNHQERQMEKYGVDVNADHFEKDADAMVKNGTAKDLDEAREKVATTISQEKIENGTAEAVGTN